MTYNYYVSNGGGALKPIQTHSLKLLHRTFNRFLRDSDTCRRYTGMLLLKPETWGKSTFYPKSVVAKPPVNVGN